MRDQLKQRNQWKLEAEQTRELIDLLSPQIEWLAVHTALARVSWLNRQARFRDITADEALENGAQSLAQSEAGKHLFLALETLKSRVENDTCNDHGYMIQFGVDVGLQRGKGIRGLLSSGTDSAVQYEVERRFTSLLGERLLHHLSSLTGAVPVPPEETIEPLACERDARGLLSSLKLKRTLAEIESRLAHAPDLDAIDNA